MSNNEQSYPMPISTDWGWTSYRKTVWGLEGRTLYVGHFATAPKPGEGYQTARILFLALRPVLAMRTITDGLNAGKSVEDFAEQIIN